MLGEKICDSLICLTSFFKEQYEIVGSKHKEVVFLRHVSLFFPLCRLWTSLKEKCSGNIS